MKIRYFKHKHGKDYYAVCGDRVMLITESGYMKKTAYEAQELIMNHSMGLINEISAPDADNIEDRHIWPDWSE